MKNCFTNKKGERGLTLIETLVALAIMSFVAVTFIAGLGITINASTINKDQIDAQEMAKSQMEYVKSQDYDDDVSHNPPDYAVIAAPTGYFISSPAERMDPIGDGMGNDDGIQRITVRVYKGVDASGSLIIEYIGYKIK